MIISGTDLCYELDVTDEGTLLCVQDECGDFLNIDREQASVLADALKHYALTGELPE